MPIVFRAFAGSTVVDLSSDCCGTCNNFYHRSYRAGGCKCEHIEGELSIDTIKCDHWVVKPMYASELKKVIDKVVLCPNVTDV